MAWEHPLSEVTDAESAGTPLEVELVQAGTSQLVGDLASCQSYHVYGLFGVLSLCLSMALFNAAEGSAVWGANQLSKLPTLQATSDEGRTSVVSQPSTWAAYSSCVKPAYSVVHKAMSRPGLQLFG